MKKWIAILAVLVLCMSVASALAEPVVVDTASDRGITPKGRLEDGSFANNPRIEGESMTTGLPFTGTYLPMLTSVDNSVDARPQWGIASADVLYELPIQGGGFTRFAVLFADQLPEQVGPIRSARIMLAELREEWDCALVNYGAQTNKGTSANSYLYNHGVYDKMLSFDGIRGGKKWTNMFKRVNTYGAPHNVTAYMQDISSLAAEYAFPERPFLFTDERPALGADARIIDITQREENCATHYEYQPETNAYLRWMGGEPFVDLNAPSTQLAYQNIIVQHCVVTHYYGNSERPLVDEVGEGNCEIFTGGKYIAGYWVRPSVESRTVFFDSEGNEIRLQRGKTVIVIADNSRIAVTYEP